MKKILLTTLFVTFTGQTALARPPIAELDGRAPFIGADLTASQTRTARSLAENWKRDASSARAALSHLRGEEQDLVQSSGPVSKAALAAILAQEEGIDRSLAAERVKNEMVIHNMLSREQLLDASRTIVVWARPSSNRIAANGTHGDPATAQPKPETAAPAG